MLLEWQTTTLLAYKDYRKLHQLLSKHRFTKRLIMYLCTRTALPGRFKIPFENVTMIAGVLSSCPARSLLPISARIRVFFPIFSTHAGFDIPIDMSIMFHGPPGINFRRPEGYPFDVEVEYEHYDGSGKAHGAPPPWDESDPPTVLRTRHLIESSRLVTLLSVCPDYEIYLDLVGGIPTRRAVQTEMYGQGCIGHPSGH